MTNEKSEIVLLNVQAERLFGYSTEGLLGQRIDILIPEEAAASFFTARFPEYLKITMSQMIDIGAELFGRHKDGAGFSAEAYVSPIENGNEKLLAFAVRDVSTRKNIEAQQQQSQNMDLHKSQYNLAGAKN